MKQKLFIILALIALIFTLIGLNALSYVQKDQIPDTEDNPNRSTYNSGATGTRAFYELLAETERKVTRWQENPSVLLNSTNKPDTFVIIGATKRDISDTESEQILRWVADGGKLVIIDRVPIAALISTTANWSILTIPSDEIVRGVDASDTRQMIDKAIAVKPVQPTIFTRSVNAVQPSRFASTVKLEFSGADTTTKFNNAAPVPTFTPVYKLQYQSSPKNPPPPYGVAKDAEDEPPVKPVIPTVKSVDEPLKIESNGLNAPFVHLANSQKSVLVDFPYGAGQIVYLTDPYIVSNAGIQLVDNARMMINVVASRDGLIAFDEYHQGYGANENRLLSYFAETPVLPIIAQIILLILLLFWSQSRRFARPLPTDEPNRLSKLEYVSAFAELQQRTRAYDLAIENIYSEFRRSVTRLFGIDNYTAARKELAKVIAERGKFDELEIYNLMKKCEDIIHGEPTNKKEVVRLASRLREIEEKLGIRRTRKQNI